MERVRFRATAVVRESDLRLCEALTGRVPTELVRERVMRALATSLGVDLPWAAFVCEALVWTVVRGVAAGSTELVRIRAFLCCWPAVEGPALILFDRRSFPTAPLLPGTDSLPLGDGPAGLDRRTFFDCGASPDRRLMLK